MGLIDIPQYISWVKYIPKAIAFMINLLAEYRGIVFKPRQQFTVIAGKRDQKVILSASTILVINIVLAEIVQRIFVLSQVNFIKSAAFEAPRYVTGIILFLFFVYILVYGVKLQQRKILSLFYAFAYSSVIYIPYTIVIMVTDYMAIDPFVNFWSNAMSGNAHNIQQLFQPFVDASPYAILLSFVLVTVLFWWARIMHVGLSVFYPTTEKIKRGLKLGLAMASYFVTVYFIIPYSIVFVGICFTVKNCSDFENMNAAIKQNPPNYARALVYSAKIDETRVPKVAKYRSLVIGSMAQIKVYSSTPEKDLQKPLALIRDKKYHEASLFLKEYATQKILDRKDPAKPFYHDAIDMLGKAEIIYNSTFYSEAPLQTFGYWAPISEIPVSVLP